MTGLGTIVNFAAIVAGGIVGSFIRNGLSQRFKSIIMQAIGLSVLVIGISGMILTNNMLNLYRCGIAFWYPLCYILF